MLLTPDARTFYIWQISRLMDMANCHQNPEQREKKQLHAPSVLASGFSPYCPMGRVRQGIAVMQLRVE